MLKIVIFWFLFALISNIISRPPMLIPIILSMLIITGFGTVFTLLINNEVVVPFSQFSRRKADKDKDKIIDTYSMLILKSAGIFLLVTGFASFINGFLCALGVSPWVTEKTELPFTSPGCYTVDKEERLYCGLEFYCRIQLYDSEGNFIKGWFLNSGGGRLEMQIDDKNQLHVANFKGHTLLTFSPEAELVEEKPLEGDVYSEVEKWEAGDKKGERIIKIIQSKIPVYKWILFGPQCFIFIIAGMLLTGYTDKFFKKNIL